MQNGQSVLIMHSDPKQGDAGGLESGGGGKYPLCDFGRAFLAGKVLRKKSAKIEKIAWFFTTEHYLADDL